MFPRLGSQILIGPSPPEDFHVMEVKNVSRDARNVAGFERIARGKLIFLKEWSTGAQVLDLHVEPVVLRVGVHIKQGQMVTGIIEMSIAAKLKFPTLLVRGDTAQ